MYLCVVLDPGGEGNGGESVWGVIEGQHKRFFEAEYLPKIRHSEPGLLSMVSLGNNLIGSQFFFTLGNDLTSLDGVHCVIGQVVEGLDVVRKLNEAICDDTHRPFQDIRITHTVILEDPFDNPRGFREPSRSPSPTAERLRGGRIGADESIDDTTGKSEQEIQEMQQDREAKARATILEIVGDLPDADIAPPENVLFVCKLNAVTTDDDMEIIFSRFGKIKGCEVIRDRKTGDSLQYAFVEFEEQKSCEAAYLKMDNVLIDDRRIHVDFSQSVAKVQWRGKGRGLIIKDGGHDNRLNFNNYKGENRGGGGKFDRDRRDNTQRFDHRNGKNRNDNNLNGNNRTGNNTGGRGRSRSPFRGNRRNSPDRDRFDRNRRPSPVRDRRRQSQSRSPTRHNDRDRGRNQSDRTDRSQNRRSSSRNRDNRPALRRSNSRGIDRRDERRDNRWNERNHRNDRRNVQRAVSRSISPPPRRHREDDSRRRKDVIQHRRERKNETKRSPTPIAADDHRDKEHKSEKRGKQSKKNKKTKKKSKKSKKSKRKRSSSSSSDSSSSDSSSSSN